MDEDPNKHQNELAAAFAANEIEAGITRRVGMVKDALQSLSKPVRQIVIDRALFELNNPPVRDINPIPS